MVPLDHDPARAGYEADTANDSLVRRNQRSSDTRGRSETRHNELPRNVDGGSGRVAIQ